MAGFITVNTYKKRWGKIEQDMRKATHAGLDDAANRLTNMLRANIYAYKLVWRGRLLDSIKVNRIKKSELNIEAVFYAPFLEKGHRIPKGARPPMLVSWARSVMPRGVANAWLETVQEEGHMVKPKPFIMDSIRSVEPHIADIVVGKMEMVK